jgi:tetratricopeptide (TPR) repeat protein
MPRIQRSAWLVGALVLMPMSIHAQQPEQLQTTASAAAAASFRSAMYESQNLGPARALTHVAAAASDPQFGLARVYQALLAPGLTAQQREAQMQQHLATMGKAQPAEILLAVYWRESAAGRGAAAVPILKLVTEMVPGDAEVGYIYNGTQRAGKTPAEQVTILRAFLARFPNHAAAHNQMAYTLWNVGDRNGALASAEQYERHAPSHPNAHDTHADILLLLGRSADAIPHVQRELELDPNFQGAYTKLGSIHLTLGQIPQARSHFAQALSQPGISPADRVEAMYWQATSYVYTREGSAAIREVVRVADLGREANAPGVQVLAHSRAAVLDAYMGNGRSVATHLTAASSIAANDNQRSQHQAHAAISLSRAGQQAEARRAAAEYAKLAPGNPLIASIDALLALDARDYRAAETAVAKLTGTDVLSRALRAELMFRTGRRAEAEAARKELLATSVKIDGQPPVNFFSVIGRMRLAAL